MIKIIASNKLYAPTLDDKPIDTEVSSWLHAMLTSSESRKDVKLSGGILA